jgi:hypothetical protein
MEGMIRRVHYDLYYVDNRSLLLDVRTMGRTLGVLVKRPRDLRPLLEGSGGHEANGSDGNVVAPGSTTVKGVTP